MKLLFDQNLSFKLCRQLLDVFPGSTQVRLLGLAEADDREILALRKGERFRARFAGCRTLRIWRRFTVRLQKSSGCDAATNPRPRLKYGLRDHADGIVAFVQSDIAACWEIY